MYEDLAKQTFESIVATHNIGGGTAIILDAINKAVTETREQLLTDFKAAREADLALIGKQANLIAKQAKEIDHGKE